MQERGVVPGLHAYRGFRRKANGTPLGDDASPVSYNGKEVEETKEIIKETRVSDMVFPLSHYRLSNFSTPRASLLCGSILLANSTKGLHHDLVSNGTLPFGFSSVEKFSPNWYNESKIVQRAQAYFFEQCHQLVGEIVIRKN